MIVGAGGLGREVYHVAADAREAGAGYDVAGFLDERADALLSSQLASVPVLGDPMSHVPEANERFLMALGDLRRRCEVAKLLGERGGTFLTLVAPTARVTTRRSNVAEGCFFDHYALVSTDVSIGRHVHVGAHAVVGHDVTIGDGTHLGAFSFIGGGARLGAGVTVRSHATICPGAIVEDGATVGPNSVVLRRVRAGETVFGVPAVRVVA